MSEKDDYEVHFLSEIGIIFPPGRFKITPVKKKKKKKKNVKNKKLH
jgi:hypothetical protein